MDLVTVTQTWSLMVTGRIDTLHTRLKEEEWEEEEMRMGQESIDFFAERRVK